MVDDLTVKLFADGADLDGILALAADPRVSGFTTNPTLMWKAGLTDYHEFAQRLLERVTEHPISFEVFADDEAEILRQAKLISAWGDNVYVKVPVSTTDGQSLAPLVRAPSRKPLARAATKAFKSPRSTVIVRFSARPVWIAPDCRASGRSLT